MNLYNIAKHCDSPEKVYAVVEIPKDTNVKYEYRPDLEAFIYDRSLLSSMIYPSNYGFIPSTKAGDGDALDVLIYNGTSIDRATIVECKIIGVLDMEDEGEKDYKVLATPVSHVKKYRSLEDIDPNFLNICKNFFSHYKDLNRKKVEVFEWYDNDFAKSIVEKSYIKY
jgi:inorganic pyrophosphatase